MDLFDLPFEEDDEEPIEEAPVARERRVFTVSELTSEVRSLLENRFFEIWIEGELSNCRVWNTGHLYFTLKDSSAQVKAVMFRSALRVLRFKPEDGQHIVARGRLSVYDPKGEYQLVCEHMEPRGLGALQLAFDQLKRKLQAEGLFEAERKRPLPILPRKIGVVTSLDGAALRDIIKVLRRRYPNAHLVIRPARVQGEGAATEVAQGLRAIARVPGVDVVIVGRGGGSIEDLSAFNHEIVARAIVASPVPVISAVGHEVDVTIADFVADVRAPTPSAAAELVVQRKDDFCARIDRLASRIEGLVRHRIQQSRARIHRSTGRAAFAGFPGRLALHGRAVAELTHALGRSARAAAARSERRYHATRLRLESHDPRRRMAAIRGRLVAADSRLAAAANRRRHASEAKLGALAGRLENLSPLRVLGRGYAVCWNADRSAILRRVDSVATGDQVHVTLERGELNCQVTGVRAPDTLES